MKKVFLLFVVLFISFSCESETVLYTLDVTVIPEASGSVSPSSGEYEEGSTVTLNVTANVDHQFDSWGGNASGNNTPLTITMNGNKSITANFTNADTDGDGVSNAQDQCPDTPMGTRINAQGCPISLTDSDGDGVLNIVDQDNNTRIGVPVDANGVMLNPVYLDENGVTIKSKLWGIVGDVGEINGVQYTIADSSYIYSWLDADRNLNELCTSLITDMRSLFGVSDSGRNQFNGDISNWDVSKVTNMAGMFTNSVFNGDISNWDVSNVTTMEGMFKFSDFNQDIGGWDVSSVTNMSSMFRGSFETDFINPFNQDISNWDVSNVTNMARMFQWGDFNQDIGGWDVSSVNDMSSMFRGSFEAGFLNPFNQDISNWDVSNVTNMARMFMQSDFNKDLSGWDVGNVTDCEYVFFSAINWTLPKPNFTNCTP